MTITQKILKKQPFPLVLRVVSLIFFILIMFALYFGSLKLLNINFESKTALIIIWTLWWPFLYITLLFLARAWCGFICPISLANETGNKIRKGRVINVVKWSFIAYIIFFFVVFLEQTSGLFLSVNTTLIFFGIFFIASFIFGLLFSRWSFCRLICPIGTLLGVFSRLSFIGLRTQKEKCQRCKTKECLTGGKAIPCPMNNNVPKIESNRNCLLCSNCIKNCPHDSPDIMFVQPGKEVIDEVNFSFSESLFIVSLIGLTFVLNSRGTQLFRKIGNLFELTGSLLRLMDFILAIGITLLIFVIITSITSKLIKINVKSGLKKFGYNYLPLAFSIMFFTIVFGFLSPYINLTNSMIAISKYVILLAGIIWSSYFSYRIIYKKYNQGKIAATTVQIATIIFIGLFFIGYLIPGPLNLFSEEVSSYTVKSGEVVNMKAFSMGYNPSTIITKKGQQVVIDLVNEDITHAFDIDEFNVHNIILGGKTTKIMFMPDKSGEFEYSCSIPGHTEAGMKGKLIVLE
ncbi:MAG: cupredoxin domain-containing protein [Nanoarchaeota archaeon]|nr:cupredoxin domain-containing protein [Nanoarchaeota archaeon]